MDPNRKATKSKEPPIKLLDLFLFLFLTGTILLMGLKYRIKESYFEPIPIDIESLDIQNLTELEAEIRGESFILLTHPN